MKFLGSAFLFLFLDFTQVYAVNVGKKNFQYAKYIAW